MKRNKIFFLGCCVLLMTVVQAGLVSAKEAKPKPPPNIVLIYADDMGYGDLNSFGASQYITPNLDRLAAQGMRFTSFYVSHAICSASRAALLTGCYSTRVGIGGALFPKSPIGLNPEEETIAEVLKKRGYTSGIFGKWHLGDNRKFLPLQQGFDEYFGLPYSNDMWNYNYDGKLKPNAKFPPLPLMNGNDMVREIATMEDQAQLTTLYTERAVAFINKNNKKPFFLYLPHSMPHIPIAASSKFKGKSDLGAYGDVMMEIDWSVGQIMEALRKNGIDDNTLVIFTSDNGPWLNFGNHAGSAGGLREGKGTTWEGGMRVPCIMRWPGHIPEGVVCNKIASTIDILPTLANMADASLPVNKIDGVNILSLMTGDQKANPREVFLYYNNLDQLDAVRKNQWKLVFQHPSRTYVGFAPGKDGSSGNVGNAPALTALYDMRRDPGERYDVKDQNPEIVATLTTIADAARSDLGDKLMNIKGANVREPGRVDK
ncbi:sulfatase [Chitinophaga sp. MM2321]|uniref:sulfatase family protein n=1 Tax=Chitinophaga sp. MM2321 TaxID=3137178 RepID=UPI0032D59A26